MSLKSWWELCAKDFIRQRFSFFIGDRAAAYGPSDAEAFSADEREWSFVTGSLDAATLASLRKLCQEKGLTFHSLLCSSLLLSYSAERSIRHPPKSFTTDRLIRGTVLFVVAVVATLLSATGSNKSVNYLASFLGIFAGVMSVHKLTELPPGFAHVTVESEVLLRLKTTQEEGHAQDPAANDERHDDTDTQNLVVQRRRCTGRVAVVVDAASSLWDVCATYHAGLRDGWVETGAGYRLSEIKMLMGEERSDKKVSKLSRKSSTSTSGRGDTGQGGGGDTASLTKFLLLFRRVVLRLDDESVRGGRTLGLAVRQLPLPLQSSGTATGGAATPEGLLPPPWIALPGFPDGTYGGLDESAVGAGFSLGYSTGQDSGALTEETTTASTGTATKEDVNKQQAACAAPGAAPALSLTLGFVRSSSAKGSDPDAYAVGHANAVLRKFIDILKEEAVHPNAKENELEKQITGNSKKEN